MIALIVCGIFIILGIIIAVIAIVNYDDGFLLSIGITCPAVFAVILLASLIIGSSIKKDEKKYLYERHKIVLVLEQNLSEESINDAQKFNKEIDLGNNYWCRFSIEDREYLKIDINSYLNNKEEMLK